MLAAMYFDADYREHATLRDGTEVTIRLLRPDDKDLLRDGFEKLSPESRYLRFFTPKATLTDEELRYLTEIDYVTHFAIGAVTTTERGDEGLGIARFIAIPDEDSVAEAAIAVLDHMHGQGLGTLLFQRLVAAARERNIARLRCEVLGTNKPMQDFLQQLTSSVATRWHAGVATIDLAVPDIPARQPLADPPRDNPLYKLFKAVARGVLSVRMRTESD